jgi:hypothetical protein
MMQMLAAGGLPPLTDGRRFADEDNPKGYFEWEPVKRLAQEPALIRDAEGMAVKVVSALLATLPTGHDYKVLFLRRSVEEVVASQEIMIRRRGTAGGALDRAAMIRGMETHLKQILAAISLRRDITLLPVDYRALLSGPLDAARPIPDFLGIHLDVDAMAACVDQSLYRQRIST